MSRPVRYLLLWLAAMSVAAAVPLVREADWWLLGQVNHGAPPPWHKDVALVDLPERPKDQREAFRRDLAALLQAMLQDPAAKPKAVVLDIAFERLALAQPELLTALELARKLKVNVYAVVNLQAFGRDTTSDFLKAHDKVLYEAHFDGSGHTEFQIAGSTLRYLPVVSIESASGAGDGLQVDSLVFVVARQEFDGATPTDTGLRVINLGPPAEFRKHLVKFDPRAPGGGAFSAGAAGGLGTGGVRDLAGKVVIVGSVETDVIKSYDSRRGPEVVSWALNDRVAPGDYQRPRVISSGMVHAAAVLVVSGLAVGLFYLMFRALPAQRSRLWLLGPLSALLSLGALAVFVIALRDLGSLYYVQVTLPTVGTLLATALLWRYWRRRQAEDALSADLERRRSAAASQYDVFISYSREPENKAWVTRHVYEPLKAARRADGSALRIFFDTESIEVGVTWYGTLAEAINNSRFFVPVYSADYFQKAFCQFEIEQAAIKRAGQKDFVLPIARVMSGIPPGFQQINAIDVALHPDFIEKILALALAAPRDA